MAAVDCARLDVRPRRDVPRGIRDDTPFDGDLYLGPFYRLVPATWITSSSTAAVLVALAPLLGEYLLRLLPLAAMVLAVLWVRPHVNARFATSWWLMAVGAAFVLFAAAIRRWRPTWIAMVAVLVGTLVRIVDFSRFPIEDGADMLPLTNSALTSFVAGHAPYAYYNLPDPLPLTYLPLTWLAHAPPFLASVDIRCTNIAAELAIFAAVVVAGRPRGGEPRAATSSTDLSGAALLVWSVLWNEHTSWARYVGFGIIFWRHGHQRLLAPVQLVLVAALVVSFARRAATPSLLASYVAAALVTFMAFNSVHSAYFYQSAIFCGLLAVARHRVGVYRAGTIARNAAVSKTM
jgi:hypothetical protein